MEKYITYRNDRLTHRGGGTAVLVKKSIPHAPAPKIETRYLKQTGIILNTKEGNIYIYSVYLPPGIDLPEQELDKVLSGYNPIIIAGDINAKHVNWNSYINNPTGATIRRKKSTEYNWSRRSNTHLRCK